MRVALLSSSSASRLYVGCACVCGGGPGQGDGNGAQDLGGRGGFSTFLYLCNQREEKFLWLFLRMVCSQDLEHLFHQQPFASFPGGDRSPSGLGRQCQAALNGSASTASSHPHCQPHCLLPSHHAALRVSRIHLSAWRPSAPCHRAGPAAGPLCPPVGAPWPPSMSQNPVPVRA